MDAINWGIIGCGDVCEIKNGPEFVLTPHSKLVGVMRRDLSKARSFAKRHHVPKWSNRPDDILEDDAINAIYIATPPKFHIDYVLQAIALGKNVYVEKPMAKSMREIEAIIEASQKHGVKVCVAHYRRSLTLYREVLEIIQNGVIGKVQAINLSLFQPNRPTCRS